MSRKVLVLEKMTDTQLLGWKDSYETLIKDNGPDSSNTNKFPNLIPSWKEGLERVQAEIDARAVKGKQLNIF